MYSTRAKNRLKIAAHILRTSYKESFPPELKGDAFYNRVLEKLYALYPIDRTTVQETVDWVEGYDAEIARQKQHLVSM